MAPDSPSSGEAAEPPAKLQRTSTSPSIAEARAQAEPTTSQAAPEPSNATAEAPPTPLPPADDSPPPSDLEDALPAKRVSYYVQAAEELLDSVLKHEAFLFSDAEQAALRRLRGLDYQARYLFVRLYLRKDAWIRLRGLSYERDVDDLDAACESLWERVSFTPPRPPTPPPDVKPVKLEEPGIIDLTGDDDDDEDDSLLDHKEEEPDLSCLALGRDALGAEDPEVILNLLSIDELVALGKKMKVNPGKGSRREWTQGLLKTSSQSTLSFFASPSTKKGKGKENSDVKPLGSFGVGFDSKGNKLKASTVASSHALKTIGSVVRLSPAYRLLFDRLSLVFHRTSYTASSNTSSFTSALLARFGKRRYPDYVVSRTFAIFPSRSLLKQYEEGLEVERRIEEILGETGWVTLPPGTKRPIKTAEEKKREKDEMCRDGVELFLRVEGTWKALCKQAEKEMKSEEDDDEKRLLYYRRRFHPGWPLTRVVYKAASIYAKLEDHDREVGLLRALLAQTSFRRGKRGAWYDRLALVMMRYPLGEEAQPDCKPKKKERLAKQRKLDALDVCLQGLADPHTHLIYRSSLQRRINRIESSLDVPKPDRRIFDALLAKSENRLMEGERLDEPTIGKKSIWRASNGAELSVEELALEQYVREGWKGFHSENGILTTIFTLIFWDVIFAPVNGVFETKYQSAPLDLSTDAFAVVRRPLIDARLAAIERGEASQLLAATDDRERPLGTWAVGVNWGRFSKEDLLEIVECIGGRSLATILLMFCEEYGHRTGGVPDLCLWNPSTSTCKFSEVKGPGDHLSETQKVWIDVLLGAGVQVEVCKVVTSEDKDEMDRKERAKSLGKGKKRARTSESVDEDE